MKWDYYLILVTAALLAAIGALCVYATVIYTYSSSPLWTMGPDYERYVEEMNRYAYLPVVLLLIVLGLCIPKRVVPRELLFRFSAGILAATLLLVMAAGLETSLAFLLGIALALQACVLFLTLRKSRLVVFERRGHTVQVGSSLLHLGVVLFILDFVALRESGMHIGIFWVSALLMTGGTAVSMFGDKNQYPFK